MGKGIKGALGKGAKLHSRPPKISFLPLRISNT
jgi:hypothetical protein